MSLFPNKTGVQADNLRFLQEIYQVLELPKLQEGSYVCRVAMQQISC